MIVRAPAVGSIVPYDINVNLYLNHKLNLVDLIPGIETDSLIVRM